MSERSVFLGMTKPPQEKDLLEGGEKVWFPGKKFAEKMEVMREGLEECYEKGELNREAGLGKLIQEAETTLKPGMKIKNLSMKEVEKLQEKIKGLAIYAPEAVKIAAEILDKEKLH